MNPVYTILSLARYEAAVLLRSWFFRIFSFMTIALLVLLDTALFSLSRSPWLFRAIPSSIPYLNIVFFNLAQSVIAVFLAADFLKFDARFDTTEVIYSRSMTNAEYVFGKTLGIVLVFAGLNAVIIGIAALFNTVFAEVPLVGEAYIWYPLLITFPTLVFVTGLTYFIMVIVKNQAITFVLMLGYIASSLFIFSHQFYRVPDFSALFIPLLYSDFVGFGNLPVLFMQRGIYLALGLGFIFLTALFLKRLTQSKIVSVFMAVGAVVCIAGAGLLGFRYVEFYRGGERLRETINALGLQYEGLPNVSIEGCTLDIDHRGDSIAFTAAMTVLNLTDAPLSEMYFSLNPGLAVTGAELDGAAISFDRTIHMMTVRTPTPLTPGDSTAVTLSYSGVIDENACYLDIDNEKRNDPFRYSMYTIDKRYGFITPDYVLLTPECMWYPVAGVPGGTRGTQGTMDFTRYTLTVSTAPGLTAVAPGQMEKTDEGVFVFTPDTPLPRVAIAIGRYEEKFLEADGIEYRIKYLAGHDFFSEYFKDIMDVIPGLIADQMITYETNLQLPYTYKRLSLVETPIQFSTYPRLWTMAEESVQPEMIFMPEKCMTIPEADFKMFRNMIGRFGGRGGQGGRGGRTQSPEDVESMLFRRFLTGALGGTSRVLRIGGRGMPVLIRGLVSFIVPSQTYSRNPFPLFYSYVYHVSSQRWPVLNMAFATYISSRTTQNMPSFGRMFTDLTEAERVNLALSKQSFADILAAPPADVDMYEVMRAKSNFLFSLLEYEVGQYDFTSFLEELLNNHRFDEIDADEMVGLIQEQFGFDLEPYLEGWLNSTGQAAVIIGDPQCLEIVVGNRKRYQVSVMAENTGEAFGMLTLSFRAGGGQGGRGGFGGFGGGTTEEIMVKLDPGQTKEIGIALTAQPREMSVDTHISRNLPATISRQFGELKTGENIEPFTGEQIVDTPLTVTPGEIVVDNEDEGFSVVSNAMEAPLKRLLHLDKGESEQIQNMRFRNIPRHWVNSVNGSYFGYHRHTAHYIMAGSGESKAEWHAEIPETGRWTVYFYRADLRMSMMGGRGGRGGRQSFAGDFYVTVYHDDGADMVVIKAENATSGWNELGTYYFSAGDASVELTDRSNGRIVYADAVKWVRE